MRKKMKPGLGVIEILVILAILVCIIFYLFSGNGESPGSEKLDKQVITSTAEYLAHIDHLSDQVDEVSAQCDSLEAQNRVLKKNTLPWRRSLRGTLITQKSVSTDTMTVL